MNRKRVSSASRRISRDRRHVSSTSRVSEKMRRIGKQSGGRHWRSDRDFPPGQAVNPRTSPPTMLGLKGFRFPREIVCNAVRASHRLCSAQPMSGICLPRRLHPSSRCKFGVAGRGFRSGRRARDAGRPVDPGGVDETERLDLHVAVPALPVVVPGAEDGADRANDAVVVGASGHDCHRTEGMPEPPTSARLFASFIRRSSGSVECSLVRCWVGNAMQASTPPSLSFMSVASLGQRGWSSSVTGYHTNGIIH